MTADDEARLERAVRLLHERLRPATVVLFGSRAAARATSASDVDLGVLVGNAPPDVFAIAGLKTELEEVLGHDVDLVMLDSASPIVAMEVLRSHRILAQRDPEAFEAFTVRTLSAYFDLKRIREPIERAMLAQEPS